MNCLGMRLKDERVRLGLNQTVMASHGGVREQAQQRYEKGVRNPDSAYFQGIAKSGVDILYVLLGTKTSSLLTADEAMMLERFGALDERGKHCVQALLGWATGALIPGSQAMHFNGPIGQQIHGGAVFESAVTLNTYTQSGKKS